MTGLSLESLMSSKWPGHVFGHHAVPYVAHASCRLLEVPANAEPSDIKAAYRRKALALHPDVNSAADAAQRFAEVSGAYGELSALVLLAHNARDSSHQLRADVRVQADTDFHL